MSKPTRDVRCAIYTRKSHEEGLDQEFNSLDAQRQSAEAYIESQRHEGWKLIRKRYDDAAYSGGTLERPALQQLLADIQDGHIDCVVVYKVDRLSRSLLDFAKLINLFDEHGVSFVSVTQQFNTTTSMGRLTLNILLSFAQFEREIIGERIRDKKQATASQGKYVGGGPILGLDVVDKKYVVNREEAKLVRDIFDRFEKLESCRKVAVALNAEGLRTKVRPTTKSGKQRGGKPWRQRSVYEVLINRRYIGQIVHKGKAYPGEHEAIVPTEQFERVQKQLSANKTYTHKHQVKHFVLLRRMIRCGHCGARVQPSWTRKDGREYRYYACTKKVKEGYGQCPLPNLPAGEIETAVVDQLRALLRHPDVIARTYREISQSGSAGPDPATLAKLGELRMRRGQTQKSVRAVLNVADQDEGFLADELKRLNGELRSLDKSIRDLEAQATRGAPVELDRVGEALRAIDPIWDVLLAEEQRRIAQLLVEEITVSTSGIDIRFRTNGIEQIVEELRSPFDAEENGGRHVEAASAAKTGPTRKSRASNYAPASQPIEERHA